MNKLAKYFLILLIALILVMTGFILYLKLSEKKEVFKLPEYYQELANQCSQKNSSECCSESIRIMKQGGYKLLAESGCQEGFRSNSLECVGSFGWCEPIKKSEEINNSYKDKGIEVYFKDGFSFSPANNDNYFGSINFGPDSKSSEMPGRLYGLDIIKQKTAEDVIKVAETNESGGKNELLIMKPIVIVKNGLTVVKWTEGGYCENRFMEIIGKKYNYRLNSLGCQKPEEYDFNYFEDILANTKLIAN